MRLTNRQLLSQIACVNSEMVQLKPKGDLLEQLDHYHRLSSKADSIIALAAAGEQLGVFSYEEALLFSDLANLKKAHFKDCIERAPL